MYNVQFAHCPTTRFAFLTFPHHMQGEHDLEWPVYTRAHEENSREGADDNLAETC